MGSTISAAVGTRNGGAVMPNTPKDLDTVTALFDTIPSAQGGTAGGGAWPGDRNSLIAKVTVQIIRFQTINKRPVVDGVIDPGGGTLRTMNQLSSASGPGSLSASVAPAPNQLPEAMAQGISVVDVNQMPGLKPFQPVVVNAVYTRKLVRVDNCSINWFGVVVPAGSQGQGSMPHVNFTPSPWQGGYQDPGYDSFATWAGLWNDYTSVIGGQMAASGANQILVIPFYRNSQANAMGDFLDNWRDVVAAVITAALNDIDPFLLRDTFTFDPIVTSSFSNGWVAHQHFNSKGNGAAAATKTLFDLDGVAGGSNWVPTNGVIYRNRQAPGSGNPMGNVWYVGGRWGSRFVPLYGGNMNTHACCRNHLLYHGLFLNCR
jgi:hypothetical protein